MSVKFRADHVSSRSSSTGWWSSWKRIGGPCWSRVRSATAAADAARDNADVAAIGRLAGDPEDLHTLDAYCEPAGLLRASLALSSWRLLED